MSIEPRGQALCVTCISRGSEDPLCTQAELSNRLAMMLGGREAELLGPDRQQRKSFVNRIVWVVGAVVIVLFVLGFLGLR